MAPLKGKSTVMASSSRSDRQDDAILEATWCYYIEGLNQNDIAKRLNISRASVVNYLQEARRREYVRITIDPDIFRHQKLARDMVAKFGLKDALVVPSELTDRGTLERVARGTADWLPTLLEPGDRLGVAWGETVYRVAEAAPHTVMDDLTVVQLVGSRPAALGFAAETCSATLARRFGAHCINLHVPLLLTNKNLADQLRAEPVVAEQLQAVENCNKTIFAAGTCREDSHVVQAGIISAASMRDQVTKGASAVICGRIVDQGGAALPISIEDRMIGVSLDQMRNKDLSLMVGTGPDRIMPMLAAIKGGYATHIATCTDTAAAMLETTT
ncbi:sugar-binding transcriptional regulator [Parasedimentitalea maritima]|uniref:Transcriptional regulator n=1 Tax=Parasedimentitalea maritima TaxID=2578117 RepID=A0A6A4RDK3_9RHOB|nr:sugar-binding domain-containing protein [Zongyanglinia marina]KAE9631783.1 transcriptional regulator [Zongyanglinia marina]